MDQDTKNQDFVEFIDETVDMALETCETQVELDEWIWCSWSTDDARRRDAVGTFQDFRQHVLNVLDAKYPDKVFVA
jgi:hypothetical protein